MFGRNEGGGGGEVKKSVTYFLVIDEIHFQLYSLHGHTTRCLEIRDGG